MYEYLEKYPESNIYTLYFEFKGAKKETLKSYKCHYFKDKARQLQELIDWELLKVLDDILLNKAILPDRMTNKENEALRYFNTLVNENYKGDKK